MSDVIEKTHVNNTRGHQSRHRLDSLRWWFIVGILLAGTFLSLMLYLALRRQEDRLIREDFKHRSYDRMNSIASEFESGTIFVRTVAAYMQSSNEHSQTRFNRIADVVMAKNIPLQALSWNPRVTMQELDGHINTTKTRLPDYEVRQMVSGGEIKTLDVGGPSLSDRRDLFIVASIRPLDPNRSALGFDIASEPVRRTALYRACDLGEPIASGRIKLIQEETNAQFGTLVIIPVFRDIALPETGKHNRDDVVGVVVGVYKFGDTLEAAMKNLEPAGIDVHLFDESAEPEQQRLYTHSSRMRDHTIPAIDERTALQSELHESFVFEFAGRRWSLYCTPTADYFALRRTRLPGTVFAGSLFVTLLIAGYVFGQSRMTKQLRNEIVVRDRAERQVRESERRFRLLCEKLPVGIFMNDHAGNHVFANELCLKLIGMTAEQAMKLGWAQSIHPADREQTVECFLQAVRTESDFEIENRLQVDGKTSWVQVVAIPRRDEKGDFIGYMGSLMDITERKHAEMNVRHARDELQVSETKYRTIVETTKEWIWEMDLEGVNTFSNQAIESVLGYQVDEVLGKSGLKLMHEEDRARVEERLPDLIKNAEGWSGWTIRWRHKNGGIRHLESNAIPKLDPQGQLIGYRGADRDITARVEAEKQIAEQQRTLTHISRLSTMGEMVAGIAHEINQPLSAISNFSIAARNLLKNSDHEVDVAIEDWLQQIGSQSVRCGEIIRRLRQFVTKDNQEYELVDLNSVVCDSVALIKSDERSPARGIEVHLPKTPPRVYANEVQLQQVLVNLLRNACDSTSDLASPQIQVSLEIRDERVRLAVDDNGPGVSETDRANLFDAFFTTKSDGLGMGLAISKSIVEHHDGKLWLDTDTRQGARFQIELRLPEDVSEIESSSRSNQLTS